MAAGQLGCVSYVFIWLQKSQRSFFHLTQLSIGRHSHWAITYTAHLHSYFCAIED